VLAIGRRVAVSHERNSETNARLEAAGVRVISVPSSELGSVRGGPRCMTCPISREPATMPAGIGTDPGRRAQVRLDGRPQGLTGISVPDSRPASQPGPVEMPPVLTPASAGNGGGADRDQAELASASLEPAA
jgi:hypothetical protein